MIKLTKENSLGIPSYNDIQYMIIYAIETNNVKIDQIQSSEIDNIIKEYNHLCEEFKTKYVVGELDTFKRAACLLVAINKCGFQNISQETLIDISIDASLKMSEKPYWFTGKKHNIPQKLDEVNFEEIFNQDSYLLRGKNLFKESVKYNATNYVSYAETLYLWYYLATLKYKSMPSSDKSVGAIPNPRAYMPPKQTQNNPKADFPYATPPVTQILAEEFRQNNLQETTSTPVIIGASSKRRTRRHREIRY